MPSITKIDAYAIRVPIAEPIKVAFGTFRDRPMVLVRITDSDGTGRRSGPNTERGWQSISGRL
jgi:L-alanine-DL-glutamate epimerase-like enolase superfamily enzyme